MDSADEFRLSIAETRRAERFHARIPASIRRSGSAALPAFVADLSTTGFRVEAQERLPIGVVVWLKLGALEPRLARVVWNQQMVAGCRFDVPLSHYVMEQFVGGSGA